MQIFLLSRRSTASGNGIGSAPTAVRYKRSRPGEAISLAGRSFRRGRDRGGDALRTPRSGGGRGGARRPSAGGTPEGASRALPRAPGRVRLVVRPPGEAAARLHRLPSSGPPAGRGGAGGGRLRRARRPSLPGGRGPRAGLARRGGLGPHSVRGGRPRRPAGRGRRGTRRPRGRGRPSPRPPPAPGRSRAGLGPGGALGRDVRKGRARKGRLAVGERERLPVPGGDLPRAGPRGRGRPRGTDGPP
jgi:hypothetical protein